MLVAILAVAMVVQPAHHHATTGAARRRGGEGVSKHHAIGGDFVDRGRLGDFVAVTPQRWAFIVGNEEDDVLFCRVRLATDR